MDSKSKIYFPNLNGLRFIAAFLVIIYHLEQFKGILVLPNSFNNFAFFPILGTLGVILFFVLSGFLIIYLLLAEQKKTGTIKLKNFYIRRILRIWPLYYIIIILAFFVLYKIQLFQIPVFMSDMENNYWKDLFLYIVFLPFVVSGSGPYGHIIPYASQAWSIGVEEQFYLFAPLMMKYLNNKLNVLIGVLIFYFIIRFLLLPGLDHFFIDNSLVKRIIPIWESFPISCMAIGGLFAYCLFYKKKVLKYCFNTYLAWGCLILIIVLIWNGVLIPYIGYEFYAVLFAIFIVNLAASPKPILNLEIKFLNVLGKISYGLYMYHTIIIVFVLKLLAHFNIHNYLLQLSLVTILTILVSLISYNLIEKRFILRKNKYSTIISGDNAKSV